ncbi:hypothetical protein [Caballeronia sp. KNU42]
MKNINANANPFPNHLFHDFSQPLKDRIKTASATRSQGLQATQHESS